MKQAAGRTDRSFCDSVKAQHERVQARRRQIPAAAATIDCNRKPPEEKASLRRFAAAAPDVSKVQEKD
jgi:hypothetical protein